jgi:hypothetical protein
MPTRIKIFVGDIMMIAELFDTPCAKKIAGVLPFESSVNEWGDEFYCEIPLQTPLDKTATTKVQVGDIGYWPPGSALAIFFGPTPMSEGDEPVPASKVNIVGKILGDATRLKKAKGAGEILIEIA